MPRDGSGRIGSGRRVLKKHPDDPLYQIRKKYLEATNPVPFTLRDPDVKTSLYMKTTSTRHDRITPRTLKQSEIPDGRKLEEIQKCLEEFTKRYINKLVEEVVRKDSDFCSKNYLQPICAEVRVVLAKFRKWNLCDLSGSGSVLRKPEPKSTPECPKEWNYFVTTDRESLRDHAKKLLKAMDASFSSKNESSRLSYVRRVTVHFPA